MSLVGHLTFLVVVRKSTCDSRKSVQSVRGRSGCKTCECVVRAEREDRAERKLAKASESKQR